MVISDNGSNMEKATDCTGNEDDDDEDVDIVDETDSDDDEVIDPNAGESTDPV